MAGFFYVLLNAGWHPGVLSNPLLLAGIAFELTLAATIVYVPPLQPVFATAAPPPEALLLILPFPLIVSRADELRRYLLRCQHATGGPGPGRSLPSRSPQLRTRTTLASATS